MVEHMNAYEQSVVRLRDACASFSAGIASRGPFDLETHEALERVLQDERATLQKMT
jgi:hypothetical protein